MPNNSAPPDTAPFWYGGDYAGMAGAFVYGVLADYIYTEIFGRTSGTACAAQGGGAGRPAQVGMASRTAQSAASRRPKQ